MKAKRGNLKRLNTLGNGDLSSQRESLPASLKKKWRQRLGCYSIFASFPAMAVSHFQEARAEDAKEPEPCVAGRTANFLESLTKPSCNPALLKRQSKFRLPHQQGSFDLLAALGGNDDCPGRIIPGGSYTAAAPYTDSGDTTGANDTVNSLQGFYYNYDSVGPDHVYSFTLTGRGPNPQIEVSTTSSSYRPMIYVLPGGAAGACPAGTGNHVSNQGAAVGFTSGGNGMINSLWMNFLPLNVPLYLFVDSSGPGGAGPYTIRIQDVTIAPAAASACANPNSIDCAEFFVRQHYLDFLNREPDAAGFNDWMNVLNNCGSNRGGLGSPTSCDRVHVSSGFYRSPEFTDRGYFVYRFYEAALGRLPKYSEFVPDTASLSGFASPAQQEQKISEFIAKFMNAAEFAQRYGTPPSAAGAATFVAQLESSAQLQLAEPLRTQLISEMGSGQKTAAQTLRAFIGSQQVYDKFFFRGFVAMQYFGYLRRDPDDAGYNDWVRVLTNGDAPTGIAPGDYRHMIFGFIYSVEYRGRFGQP